MTLSLGNVKTYLIHGPETIRELFASGKSLAKDGLAMSSFEDPRANNAADGEQAIGGETLDSPTNIGEKLQDLQKRMLAPGIESERLATRFATAFQALLQDGGLDPHCSVGIFKFLHDRMLRASTAALMGSAMVDLNPTFVTDYWAFDEALLLGRPDRADARELGTRARFLEAVTRYIDAMQETVVRRLSSDDDPEERTSLPSRLFDAHLRTLRTQMSGTSPARQAHHLAPLVWATATNAVPTTAWILVSLLQRPSLLPALRKEIASAVPQRGDEQHPVSFELDQLGRLPLLNSFYLEVLRVYTSVTVTRKLVQDIEIGGWTLRKSNFVMAPSWPAHMDGEVWGEGENGAGEFWPERFMPTFSTAASQDVKDWEMPERVREALRPETFFPYGGGGAVCPGRHFSKLEILIAVAVLVREYDFDVEGFVDGEDKKVEGPPKPRQEYAGGGVMPPDCDMMVRMTKRT